MPWIQSPQWNTYDAAMRTYYANLRAWEARQNLGSGATDTLGGKVISLQKRAEILANQIGDKAAWVWENETLNNEFVSNFVHQGVAGLSTFYGTLDADPVKGARFYVCTFVTDWGEESAPGPVTQMVELTQYDKVRLALPQPPPARNISRSNWHGRSATA